MLSFLREWIYHCIYNIITLKRSSYGNRNGNVHKNNELAILKIKLKTFRKTFSIIQYWKPQKYEAKISRDSFDPFGKSFQKTSVYWISAILFRWSHQCSRASIHISGLPSERRKICFPGVGNGKRGRSGQLQWLFLTFDPARPVTECPMSAIHRELSWYYPTARPMYNWRAAKFVPYQCKRRVHVKSNLDIFFQAKYFRAKCDLLTNRNL